MNTSFAPTDTKPDVLDAQSAAVWVQNLESQARRVETPCADGKMVWRIWGSGQPLVLAHGSHGAWSHWILTIPVLARHYQVIVPDLPGHGDSALPAAETHEALSLALEAGLQRILGEKPATFIGFSLGAIALAWLARLYPDRVRRLILVGAGGLDTPRGEIRLKRMAGVPLEERDSVTRHNLLELMLHAVEAVDPLAMYIHAHNGKRSRLDPVPYVFPDWLPQALARIKAPIDVIWGSHDQPHPNPVLQEAAFRRFQPDLRFRVIDQAGHWVMYEQPEAFNACLTALLQEEPRAC